MSSHNSFINLSTHTHSTSLSLTLSVIKLQSVRHSLLTPQHTHPFHSHLQGLVSPNDLSSSANPIPHTPNRLPHFSNTPHIAWRTGQPPSPEGAPLLIPVNLSNQQGPNRSLGPLGHDLTLCLQHYNVEAIAWLGSSPLRPSLDHLWGLELTGL